VSLRAQNSRAQTSRVRTLLLVSRCIASLCIASSSTALGILVSGCAGKKAEPTRDAYAEVSGRDDKSLCVGYGKGHEREESSAPGAPGRSIRRVYAIVGSGQYMGRVLVCREVDTNYDGVKDLVRTYDRRGIRLTENVDTNYDGKLDTWTAYSTGQVGRVALDANYDGKIDEVRHYRDGRVARIHRDTDGDGKEDTFEMYRDGRLERIGVDLDHSGQVDEWYGATTNVPVESGTAKDGVEGDRPPAPPTPPSSAPGALPKDSAAPRQ
jgi:hypothetical protein